MATDHAEIAVFGGGCLTDAKAFIKTLNASDPGGRPVVTEVKPLGAFYEAEAYYRDYFKNNRREPYCQVIIEPKVRRLEKDFAELLITHGMSS